MSDRQTRPIHRPARKTWQAAALGLMTASLLSGCQAVLLRSLNATAKTGGLSITRDVIYELSHHLALDVYRPRNATNLPVVVFFYGGSWKSGKRQWYRWAGEALAQRGLVVVIPDYRLWPKVKLNGFMHDAAHAVEWTRMHAGEYGGDNHELFVMGHSAGGHIAALLATNAHWLNAVGMKPRDLSGLIGLAGPYDFLPLKDPDYISMFGDTHAGQLRSQPVHFVDGDEPPMLLMQGTTDDIVAPRNARSLARAMHAQHETAELRMVPGIGHFALLLSMSRPLRSKAPVLDDTQKFIQQQIAKRSRSNGAHEKRRAQRPGV